MKRKRKEACPSPVLEDSPKRTKVQVQRKFAQNSGMHSPIITPIRDLEAADLLPHRNVLQEPVELLPMKRPNTEDFLTFLCFRGTPILPSNLQFFNTASIVTDGQVHEIKADSPKNGPIDISKCAGTSSDKPFIAFGVRKRADPIVISRQMERKRRHALAIQALRRRYQEQKMAKIRALTISKLSEKTTNKTLVKTNTIHKTETVTKKTNTLQKTNTLHKTKVIATKHVKVTTQTLKTKVKPKMCLRSFRGKFVQKELPFRARRAMQERDSKQRSDIVKTMVRTSKNSNKPDNQKIISKAPHKTSEITRKVKALSNARVTRSGSVTTVIRNPIVAAIVKRPQVKRRILLPSTTVTVVKPKLRSTTTKKTVISRKKAQQRVRVSVNRNKGEKVLKSEVDGAPIKDGASKSLMSDSLRKTEKESPKKVQEKDLVVDMGKKFSPPAILKRVTRKDSEMAIKNVPEKLTDKGDVKKEVTKNLELKKEVKIAETSTKKEVKKNMSLKREFRLKSSSRDVKKNVDLKKTSSSILENKEGQKVKKDVKTVEMTVKKIVTRKSEDAKQRETNQPEEKLKEKPKKGLNKPSKTSTSEDKGPAPKEVAKKSPRSAKNSNSTERDELLDKSPGNIKKVTRGCVSKKKISPELGHATLESNATKLVPIEKKESKNITEKGTHNKELRTKSPQKEESLTKHISKKEYEEIDTLKDTFLEKNLLKEELIDKEISAKSLKTLAEKDVKSPSIKKMPQRTAGPALVPKKSSLSKDIIIKPLLKESLAAKDPLDEQLAPKKGLNKIAVPATPKEVSEVSEEELASKKTAKESASKHTSIEQPISKKALDKNSPPNLDGKESDSKAITKRELITQKFPEKEILTKEATKESIAKPATQDGSTAKQVSEEVVASKESSATKDIGTKIFLSKNLTSITETGHSGQDEEKIEKVIVKKLEEKEEMPPEKRATEYVAKRKPKEEVLSSISSEDELPLQKLAKDSAKRYTPKEQVIAKKATKDENTAKKMHKQESPVKKNAKEEISKRKLISKREETEQTVQKASPRPSRKTKEAAAIYMEILSHKLVNDSTIDDDNVSIDSFPELPNVKKTEQREIELKAQAKTCKEEEEKNQLSVEKFDDKKGKKVMKGKKDVVVETIETVISENITSTENLGNVNSSELKESKDPHCNNTEGLIKKCLEQSKSPSCDKVSLKIKSPSMEKTKNKVKNPDRDNPVEKTAAPKSSLGKRKSNSATIASDSESDNEVLQAKIRKCEAQKNAQQDSFEKNPPKKLVSKQETPSKPVVEEETFTRRQTRRSTQIVIKDSESDSSDESFYIDVRVPRKKKVTRSQNKGSVSSFNVLEKNVDIILEAARVLEGEKVLELERGVETETKIDIDEEEAEEQPLKSFIKEEKSIKSLAENVKSSEKLKNPKPSDNKKEINDPSDSDESTTSDINLKSLQVRQRKKKLSKTKSIKSSVKSAATFSDSDEEPLAKLTNKSAAANEAEESKKKSVKPKATTVRKTADKSLTEVSVMEPKAKRECTKRPSNYLPMLSSSEEDDEHYFHGFNTSKEEVNRPKTFIQSLAPSLDLLSKDIGRKGKVNMSNEQIEKWLKDSALAGSSVAKENDAMLKFGEKIPVETDVVESSEATDEQVCLKLPESEEVKAKDGELLQQQCSNKTTQSKEKPKSELKSPLADRKWIFKKDKTELTPNKNAFSPENECSVYAFGEENEDVISTPFRRPSRRPSSTATSRSEDDLSKNDDNSKQGQFRKPGLLPSDSEDSRCFNIPQNPTKLPKVAKCDSMVPPSTSYHSKRPAKSTLDRFPEPFDDFKYKIPSSPSASSGSSAKLYKKGTTKQKGKGWEVISPVYVSDFPKPTDLPKLVEAPIFHPTDQEFQDPLEYIERIRHKAEQFGICKIVPPNSFKPECKVSDEMRFTAYNQYVHKMLHRWGPNFKEFMVIKKYLATQNIPLKTPPLIGGMEIDLPRLYQTVQSLGGLKEVIEKKKWSKVSDNMKIPKLAQDRVTKLDDIYCKYLLPYDTLSPAEREKLFDEVETYWATKESKNLQIKTEGKPETKQEESSEHEEYESDENEVDECTVKSKNMALNAFYRIARNTMSMYFKVAEPTAQEVEQEFWRYVTQKQNHICVHSASIDCGNWGYGFAVSKNSPFARHAWNLKVMSNNSGSVLRSLGPVMGVTIPTLHVGMVFSACCWYRDPHGLPWVEYLHTGGSKVWYGIPSSSCDVFQAAMRKLVPNYCRDKELWLPSDTAMVPPGLLMEHNVSLCRTVQEPGQFLVVFPKVFTSSVSTGYVVSESVYFAPLYWLRTARNLFNDLKSSCEPSMFSLDKLLISISNDSRSSVEILRVIMPFIEELYVSERDNRVRLRNFGKIEEEKIVNSEVSHKKKKMQSVEDVECEICRMNLFVSMVIDTQDDLVYCLEHAIDLVAKNSKMLERFKLRYAFDVGELESVPAKINFLIEAKLQKKVPSKYAGLPTMLK